ncbi:hypothetical protein Z043_124965, partial [Scleropages formosus]
MADYPSSISTIQDVCVVIPCTYKYPDTKPNTEKTWTGYWYINENDKQAVYDEKIANVLSNFKNRTRLVGNLSQGNCSLMINDVKKADHQKMYFRIQIKNLDNYSFLKKTVSITVQVRAIEVPKTMSALGGSCLVIPCKFLCPDLSNPINTSAGFWLASSTTDFVYHTDSSKVAEQYKGRTQLIGDLKKGNCSLKIDHLQYNDNGPFYFRIEMTNYNFSFIEYKVSIAILVPENPSLRVSKVVRVGENVSALCSVNHSCISHIPPLTWNHKGSVTNHVELLSTGQWNVTSVLKFIPTISDNTKNLICTAEYNLQNKSQSSSTLDVR